MLKHVIVIGLLGVLCMLGAGCTKQSADKTGESSKAPSPSEQAGGEKTAKTKPVTLEITGMT